MSLTASRSKLTPTQRVWGEAAACDSDEDDEEADEVEEAEAEAEAEVDKVEKAEEEAVGGVVAFADELGIDEGDDATANIDDEAVAWA